ncbi:MAG: hypothetical protein F7B17_05295 [Desulfurococcales archaeon]|nr:hypothetical protein [Desulfurococcales archaeon]
MARKREAKVDTEAGKTKDLKIISVQVITKDKVMSNERQMALLYIIDKFGPLYERALQQVVYDLQQLGAPLGYEFKVIAGVPYSPEFKNDLVALGYVGFIEYTPNKKVRVTNDGKDALEKKGAPKGVVEVVERHFEEVRNKATIYDYKVDEGVRRMKTLRRGEGRRLFGLRV